MNQKLDKVSVAFGLSAAIAIIFNTLLALIKDANKPLQDFMATIGGHHWITHGVADVLLFVLLGSLFYRMNFIEKFNASKLSGMIIISIILSVLGLLGWFLLF